MRLGALCGLRFMRITGAVKRVYSADWTEFMLFLTCNGQVKENIDAYSVFMRIIIQQEPVVQSIVSLTSSLRGQLVKRFSHFFNKSIGIFEKLTI